ncbi:MAG: hypothetical protein ACFFD4_34570 [Candidatus Odinarchaeota archaeon]
MDNRKELGSGMYGSPFFSCPLLDYFSIAYSTSSRFFHCLLRAFSIPYPAISIFYVPF